MRQFPLRTSRAAVVGVAALGLAVAGPSPAFADPTANLALFPVSVVGVGPTTTTSATVCASGWVDSGTPIVGEWLFSVIGTTSTFTDLRGGATYAKTCFTVYTDGTPAGATEASLTYVGIGGDVIGQCTGALGWAPGVSIRWLGGVCTGTTPVPAVDSA